MPKYSPVAPINLLEQLYVKGLLGDYLLFLAHDVMEHMHAYVDLANDLRMKYGDDLFIIMDNGVVEQGVPVPLCDILSAADAVEANCIVAPDVLGDQAATKKLMMDREVALIMRDYEMMFVPQGKTVPEVCSCINWMAQKFPANGGPRYWGIPRWIANEVGSRAGPINYINTYYEDAKIHLLGMSQHLTDDIVSVKTRNVIGIDSANPLVLGYNGVLIDGVAFHHKERGTYWNARTRLNSMMEYNVRWVRNAIAGS